MILSMTGFGRAEGIFDGKKICIDIKSLNSKSFDLNIKTPLRYKEKEFEIRKILNDSILRGKIDCYISFESLECANDIKINQEIVKSYMEQLRSFATDAPDVEYLKIAIRMPEAINSKTEELPENEWIFLQNLLTEALQKFIEFRKTEGIILEEELEKNILNIENLLNQVLPFEEERITCIKERYQASLKEFDNIDETRFYQEMAYFIEKLDISEEKVRLAQHLKYYIDVMKNEECNGKKLGFISQEIGREINTLGSKANHHQIQKLVVMMKDNLDWVLGQMSPWHIFQAGFSHFSDVYMRFNSLLLAFFFLYIIEKKVWVMLCFSPILFLFIQSPSPDLPSIVFALIILNEILSKNQNHNLIFAVSVIVFSIKPTMFWLPFLAFFNSVLLFRTHIKFVGLGILLGVLYLVKNIWVFGYPLFPMQVLDLGLSWKPYTGLFEKSREIALLKTFDLQFSLKEITQFTIGDYIKNWVSLKGIKGVVNTSFVLSLVGFGIYALLKKDRLVRLVFVSVLVKSLFVIWFSAQYRFFVEVFFVIFIVILGVFFNKKYALIVFSIFGVMIANILFFPKILREHIPSFNLGYVMQDFRWKQLYKPSYYIFNQYQTHQIGNLKFNIPKNYVFAFDVALPVIPLNSLEEFERYGIFPQLQGNTWKEGFVWRKLEEKERIVLRKIIEKIKNED